MLRQTLKQTSLSDLIYHTISQETAAEEVGELGVKLGTEIRNSSFKMERGHELVTTSSDACRVVGGRAPLGVVMGSFPSGEDRLLPARAVSRSALTRSSSRRTLAYPERCFSISFQSWAFWLVSIFLSPITVSNAAIGDG